MRLALVLLLCGCGFHLFEPPASGGPDECNTLDPSGSTAISARMELGQEKASFFASPFPSIARTADCSLDNERFPAASPLMERLREMTRSDGYALTAAIYFQLDGAPDRTLFPPRYTLPVSAELPNVFLFRLDPGAGQLALHPVIVEASSSHLQGGAPHLLSLLPMQGFPLEPNATYVAGVRSTLAAKSKDVCDVPSRVPGCATGDYQAALDAVSSSFGVPCSQLAALAVFRTGDPAARLRELLPNAAQSFAARPANQNVALTLDRTRCQSSPYCIFTGTVQMPQYQHGTPPYAPYFDWSGGWTDEPAATVQPLRWDTARVVLTVPKHKAPPPGGFPVVVLTRSGAGGTGDPLVDRGPTLPPSCQFSSCDAPAQVYASAGYAGLTVDGPLTGQSRNDPLLLNEDLAVYDFLNPLALRDNLRQSGLELALVPGLIDRLHFDASSCDGLDPKASLDASHTVLFGHSMGAAIAPLALAIQPDYRGAMLSAANGSYILKAMYQRLPVPLSAAASVFGYEGRCTPHPADPEISLFQWALEPSDPQIYAREAVAGRHFLALQGLIDHYTLPPVADTFFLRGGLDLGLTANACEGRPDCDVTPEPNGCAKGIAAPDYPSIEKLLPLTGHSTLQLPASGNLTAASGEHFTGLAVQHRQPHPDGCPCVDGHEESYEVDLARHQQECFLATFTSPGGPRVPAGGALYGACE